MYFLPFLQPHPTAVGSPRKKCYKAYNIASSLEVDERIRRRRKSQISAYLILYYLFMTFPVLVTTHRKSTPMLSEVNSKGLQRDNRSFLVYEKK